MKYNPMNGHRIARIATVVIVATILTLVFVAYTNKAKASWDWFDTTWHFHRAQIQMPDGSTISGQVQTWKDWSDSDAVQVQIDGVTYYTHLSNVVLMAE